MKIERVFTLQKIPQTTDMNAATFCIYNNSSHEYLVLIYTKSVSCGL